MIFHLEQRETLALLVLFFVAGVMALGIRGHFDLRGAAQTGYADLLRYKPDLNSATEDELNLLPGVGPRAARAVISYREMKPFANVNELAEVRLLDGKPAFDSETLAKLKTFVTVSAEQPATKTGYSP